MPQEAHAQKVEGCLMLTALTTTINLVTLVVLIAILSIAIRMGRD